MALNRISWGRFGGLNANDQSDTLLYRAFQQVEGGFQQVYPAEFPRLRNIDFPERAIGKRLGSESLESLVSVMVASEEILKIVEWTTPSTTTRVQVAVGKKSMYTDQSGAWVRLNDSAAAAYSHAADVTRCSVTAVDNHLIIGLDGANKIQVYRSGANLDAALNNGNTWNDSFGGGTSVVTGTWGTGYYIVLEFQQRLVYSDGSGALQYTDVGQPWDRAAGGVFGCKGNVVGAMPFLPRGASELLSVLFISTTEGPEFLTGFDVTDTVKPMTGSVALNHQCIVALDNWIAYLTTEGGIEGVNLQDTIDLGRRFKALDGLSGPMDTFSPTNTNHSTKPFGYYDRSRKQALWMYPDASDSVNNSAIGLDVFIGEPLLGERKEEFERKVRCLWHTIQDGQTWFINVYQRRGALVGVLATGLTYTMNSGANDLESLPIDDELEFFDFDGGFPDRIKNFRRFAPVFRSRGNWNVNLDRYLDRSAYPTGSTITFPQIATGTAVWDSITWDSFTWADAGIAAKADWVECHAKFFRGRLYNQQAAQDWILTNATLEYMVGSRQG